MFAIYEPLPIVSFFVNLLYPWLDYFLVLIRFGPYLFAIAYHHFKHAVCLKQGIGSMLCNNLVQVSFVIIITEKRSEVIRQFSRLL